MKTIINKLQARKALLTLVAAALAAALLFVPAGCGNDDEGNGVLRVAADIMPMADFCRCVGGDLVEVEMLIPAGASPHSYELTTEQMRFLAGADILVINGFGLTPWAEEVFDKVDNADMVRVAAAEEVPESELISAGGEGEKQEGGNGAYNPHVWLDPELAVRQVEAVRDGMIEADPDNRETFEENAEAYIEGLEQLDVYVEGQVAAFTSKKFVSFHPAWSYFARRYELEQVGAVEELPGKEPGAGEIADLVDLMRAEGVKVIFTEPQLNPKAAEVIAEEAGSDVLIRSLDPLGDPEDTEKDTYIEMMKYNVGIMAEVME
ncbi:MAG: metal ABC transporter substrate-binding protein [Actinomycetota bacterium]